MASTMSMCNHCNKRAHMLEDNGFTCCSDCGRVVKENFYSTETTIFKDAGGQSRASGILGKCVEDYSESHERTVQKGRDLIEQMARSLDIGGGKDITNQASGFYRIAVDRNFTRGRSTLLVAAACLYITCRENKNNFLLIDFSEYLMENVYKLGAVFLQLCQLLRLEENPTIQKPVDPSLFIHRFTEKLQKDFKVLRPSNFEISNKDLSTTALRIVASMKRDWMQVSENTKKARTDDPGTRIINSNVKQVVAEEDDEEDYSGTTFDGAADDSYNKYGYGDDDGFEDFGYEF